MVESRLKVLREWRKHAEALARAIKERLPRAEVYVIGGAAEGRLTALSDIDILIVIDEEPDWDRRIEIREKALEAMDAAGIPPYYPFEIHIAPKHEARKHLKHAIKLA